MTTSHVHVNSVIDQHAQSRGLASMMLNFNDLLLAATAGTIEEALQLCATARPDVILLTLGNPDRDALEATEAIHECYPAVRVIVLAECSDTGPAQTALPADGRHYPLQCISAVEWTGSPPADTSHHVPDKGADLTAREHEVLALMAHGLTNGQIGTELVISRATAKFHVSSILGKMGAVTRTEAVAMAVQSHLTIGPN